MKWIFLLVALLTAALFQIQAPLPVWLVDMKLPVVLSSILYYALTHERAMWVAAALVGGLLCDALSSVPMGYSAGLLVVTGWLASRFRRRLVIDAVMTSVVLAAFLNVFFTACQLLFLSYAGLVETGWVVGIMKLLLAAFLGAVTGPVVCGMLGSIEHNLGNRDRSTGYA